MGKRHKWADVAIAFAEGKAVQVKDANGEWQDWDCCVFPAFHNDQDWRIKPAEPVVRWLWVNKSGEVSALMMTEDEAKATLYGSWFCLPWSRTEIPAEE